MEEQEEKGLIRKLAESGNLMYGSMVAKGFGTLALAEYTDLSGLVIYGCVSMAMDFIVGTSLKYTDKGNSKLPLYPMLTAEGFTYYVHNRGRKNE